MTQVYPSGADRMNDIIRRRLSGESFAQIAKAHNISRQRAAQLCKRYGIKPEPDVYKPPFDVERAVHLIKKGYTIKQVSATLSVSGTSLKTHLKKSGHDYESLRLYGLAHQWDGRTFGDWIVQSGSYRREHPKNRRTSVAYVTCECAACGTVRDVSTGNLTNGFSRGCGCRNSREGGRTVTPWVCKSVKPEIRVESTYQLAKALGANYARLNAIGNKEEVFVDKWGRAWVPQTSESIPMGTGSKAPVDPRAVIPEGVEVVTEERTEKEEKKVESRFRAIFRHLGNRLSIG